MRIVGRSAAVVVTAVALVGALALPAHAKTDKQIAKAASIKASDLPQGWTSGKADPDEDSGIAACEATEAISARSEKYEFESPEFTEGDSLVSNSVYVFETVKQAKEYLETFQEPDTLDCLQEGIDAALAETPGASATVEDLDVSGGPANDGVGYLATITIPDGATDVTLVFEAVAFRVGRGVTGITTNHVGEALPLTPDLATTSIKRLKKGLK